MQGGWSISWARRRMLVEARGQRQLRATPSVLRIEIDSGQMHMQFFLRDRTHDGPEGVKQRVENAVEEILMPC